MNRLLILFVAGVAGLTACQQHDSPDRQESPLTEKVTAERLASGDYRIRINNPEQYYVYLGASPAKIDWRESIAATDGSTLNVENPEKGKRLFFGLVSATDTLIISERQIPMKGAPNFRDLGGLPTRDGHHVAWGRIFRSGDLSNLAPRDLEYFSTLGIRTIVDLRTDAEAEQRPDRYPDSKVVKYRRMPIGGREGMKSTAVMVNMQDDQQVNEQIMMETYRSFAQVARDYKPVFDALLNDQALPLLLHGATGNDRTGFGAALILYALGVDKEKILEDYLLSAYYLGNEVDGTQPKAQYLEAAFAAAEEKYGSLDALLSREFGLTDAKRRRLQERLTY